MSRMDNRLYHSPAQASAGGLSVVDNSRYSGGGVSVVDEPPLDGVVVLGVRVDGQDG